jgi:uncharacterized membrane protein
MSQPVAMDDLRLDRAASKALNFVACLWLALAIVGQLVFAAGVAVFYGRAASRGDVLAWNSFMTHGYMPGHAANNLAAFAHVAIAVLIIVAGALQLLPQLRRRAPALHRWTGRFYLAAACGVSLTGLWMMWVRGSVGGTVQHLGLTLNAVLVLACAVMALRHAMARDFATHRRWALRLFLVVSGVWFFRVGVFLSFLIFQGPFGFNPRTFVGPFLDFMTFAQYLLPLAVLECYFRTQARPGPWRRISMTSVLAGLTVAMGAGIAVFTFGLSVPALAGALGRHSATETLSVLIATDGIDAAVRQYWSIKTGNNKTGKNNAGGIAESDLDSLGYELLHSARLSDAIRIFQLNVAEHPLSGNVYDSLGEAYMDAGNTKLAIENYEKSLQLAPGNANAADALRELGAPSAISRR